MQRRRREHRCVQRLANMAGVFRTVGVVVEKAAACGKIEQREAREYRYCVAQFGASIHRLIRLHCLLLQINILRGISRRKATESKLSTLAPLDPATISREHFILAFFSLFSVLS